MKNVAVSVVFILIIVAGASAGLYYYRSVYPLAQKQNRTYEIV